MKVSNFFKKIENWGIILSVITFFFAQWQQIKTLEAQTIVSNRGQLQMLIKELRETRDPQDLGNLEEKFSIDIATEHYAAYMDARIVMDELPQGKITPSQYLAIAFESWEIGARGFESLELAEKAVLVSEPGSIDQLDSLSELARYYLMLAEIYPDKRENFVMKAQDANRRMRQNWPHSTEWRRKVLEAKQKEFDALSAKLPVIGTANGI